MKKIEVLLLIVIGVLLAFELSTPLPISAFWK